MNLKDCYLNLKDLSFQNKIWGKLGLCIIFFILFVFVPVIFYMFISPSSNIGDSKNTAQLQTDVSSNKSVGGDSSVSVGKDYTRVDTSGGDYTGGDKIMMNNITNNYPEKVEEKVDVVYEEINITGKVVDKVDSKKGIEGIKVKLVSFDISSDPSDKDGNFYIYKKQPTYKEISQIKIEETDLYKNYLDDIDLNAHKILIKLDQK